MKVVLFLLLSLLMSFTSYSQGNDVLTPFKILELNLSSLPQSVRAEKVSKTLGVLEAVAFDNGVDLPKHKITLGELGSLPMNVQNSLNIPLLKAMNLEGSLKKTYLQTLYLQNIHTPSDNLKTLYLKETQDLKQLQQEIQKRFGKGIDIKNLMKTSKELRKIVFSPENFKSIPIYDGFEFIDQSLVPESVSKLEELLEDSKTLNDELNDFAQKRLSQVSEYDQIKNFNEYKEYVDTSKLNIGGSQHALGKAKKTFINKKMPNGEYKPIMISKVVLHNSEDAFIYIPDELDINEPNLQSYILKQHAKAATTYDGFKDMQILKDKHVETSPLTAFADWTYGSANSDYRMKRSIKYWKAKFKSTTLTGRNLYIVRNSGKVIYSPKPKLFSAQYWKSGKAFKKFGRIIYAAPKNGPFAFAWGAINAGIAFGSSTLILGKTPLEAFVFASSIAVFSTVFTAYTDFLQNATKGFTPFLNKLHNLLFTTVTFGAFYLLAKHAILDDPNATLKFLSSDAKIRLSALQNLYDILIIGIVSKHFSEPWKIGTDAIKEGRMLRGNKKFLGIKYGRFQLRYQFLQLLRGTFKNLVLEAALAGGGGFALKGFVILKNAVLLLPITAFAGSISSVIQIKAMKLIEKTPKTQVLIDKNAWVKKTMKLYNETINAVKEARNKIHSTCNRLFGPTLN